MTTVEVVLSESEQTELARHEATIERGMKTFVEVGEALAGIRDSRLYRTEFDTFEDYCQQRWGFDRTRAQNFITAARVVLEISNTDTPAPTRESQARELAKVPTSDRADVWRETVECTNGKPTAAAVKAVLEQRTKPSTPASAAPDPEPVAEPQPALAPTLVPAPPVEPSDADLDASLDAAMNNHDARFRANFSAARARGADLWSFDLDRIAELYSANYDHDLKHFTDQMRRWCDQVDMECRRRRSGLRVISGGAS